MQNWQKSYDRAWLNLERTSREQYTLIPQLITCTVAQVIEAEFADGDKHPISGSYVEFAERKVLPAYVQLAANEIKREHRREGFEAANADKIFESTYSSQTQR